MFLYPLVAVMTISAVVSSVLQGSFEKKVRTADCAYGGTVPVVTPFVDDELL